MIRVNELIDSGSNLIHRIFGDLFPGATELATMVSI